MDKYILEWHRTEDKKPEDDDICLTIYNNDKYFRRDYGIVIYSNGMWICTVELDPVEAPIYWAKLPELKVTRMQCYVQNEAR